MLIVIAIAIWMANALTRRITSINDGLQKFHNGEYEKRLEVSSQDEMGRLADHSTAWLIMSPMRLQTYAMKLG